jgi:hypothetical protein
LKTITLALIVTLAATVASAFVVRPAARNDPAEKMTRARALKGLKGCAKRPRDRDCNDWSADFLIDAYWRGDRGALKALLDAEPYGDGAMAEGLGTFYSEMLEKRPRVFLRAIARRPARERGALCDAAGLTDGGGLDDPMRRTIRANLKRIERGRDRRLARVARACWAAASEADRRTKSQYR